MSWFREMRAPGRILLKAIVSLLGGGLLYTLWLAGFLILREKGAAVVETLLWILAPLATAAGFAGALLLFDRVVAGERPPFLSVYAWPLAGCILGVWVVYWYGPMLIVFSMLGLGSLSIVLREVWLERKKRGDPGS